MAVYSAHVGVRSGTEWSGLTDYEPFEVDSRLEMPDVSKLSDEELVRNIAAGDRAAFNEIMRRYEAGLLTLCYAFTRDRQDAEDLSQEAFIRVFRKADSYQPLAKFSTWLYKIATNLCINHLKKSKIRKCLSLDEPTGSNPEGTRIVERIADGETPPMSTVQAHETQDLIRKAIDHLPDDQRTTLIMVEYHHMQYQEIAEVLGVSVSAIKMRVKRARETLREVLKFLDPKEA